MSTATEQMVHYELEHQGTEAGTGWFAPMPVGQVDFEDGIDYMREHPNDEFLHRYMLNITSTFGPNLAEQLIARGLQGEPALAALMYEACLLNERFHPLLNRFEGQDLAALAAHTPLVYLPWTLHAAQASPKAWLDCFASNILEHKPLLPPSAIGAPIPFPRESIEQWRQGIVTLADLHRRSGPKAPTRGATASPNPLETAQKAQERLKAVDLQTSSETPNPASFSPHALQMKWHMDVSVTTGRHRFRFTGIQTSYGKGLSREDARASLLMEVAERVSSFAGFGPDRTLHYKNGHPLVRARLSELLGRSEDALDPNAMLPDIPYEDQRLYWIPAQQVDHKGCHPIYVPAQFVFLFCNLDETALSDGMPSTGLASGNTLEEAKLSALLEVIERDGERVMPYRPDRCFTLRTEDPAVQAVLAQARNEGLEVQFLDITTELGIPCYKGFIQTPTGQILKGCAAHLDGKRAVVSALLEVPFHASWFRPEPDATGRLAVRMEDLPSYTTGDPAQDLERLEALLMANGYSPVYVDLTREDLDIPVVKALVPGLEFFPEFDRFSSLRLRQFAHYLAAVGE